MNWINTQHYRNWIQTGNETESNWIPKQSNNQYNLYQSFPVVSTLSVVSILSRCINPFPLYQSFPVVSTLSRCINSFPLYQSSSIWITGRGCAAMVIESLSLYYHINCFRCSVCHIQLGELFSFILTTFYLSLLVDYFSLSFYLYFSLSLLLPVFSLAFNYSHSIFPPFSVDFIFIVFHLPVFFCYPYFFVTCIFCYLFNLDCVSNLFSFFLLHPS